MLILVNNTVLSNFARVQRPDLLRTLFGEKFAATEQVLSELHVGERLRRLPVCDWSWLQTITLTSEEYALATRLGETLGTGETSSIAVARIRGGQFLTDDRDARRLAQSMQVPISGTLGVLQLLVDRGYLELAAANTLLAEMIAQGYRSPVKSLNELRK